MATTYTATKAASTYPARAGVGLTTVFHTYTPSSALVINDVIQMVKVPVGATIVDMILATQDLDSNGAPAISLAVGDGGSTSRFISSSTIARTGGVTFLNQEGGFLYTYTSEDTIDVIVLAAPATWQSGSIGLIVTYTMEQ